MPKILDRRNFILSTAGFAAGLTIIPSGMIAVRPALQNNLIRLGAPVPGNFKDPAEWAKSVKSHGYSAAYCPLNTGADRETIRAFRDEASKNDIIIAEVGVWNNMLDPDNEKAKTAMEKNIASLYLADEIGANCCVNISGARGEIWDGPYPGNYEKDTFDMIVAAVRTIIDEARPLRSFYTLEPMPYMLPDSPDTYLDLIKAIDRKQFGVHLDPVNMISSPQKYYNNALFLKECFAKLGPFIKSIHAKDIIIKAELTLHLEERRPGLGALDYGVFLKEASRLNNIPFMLEHLNSQEDYKLAADYVRQTGKREGIGFAV